MLGITSETLILTATTLIYIVAVGWLLLTLFAKKEGRRIARPLLTMLQVAAISSIVFMMASVPSYVASVVNPDILPFIMPYAGVLLAVSFVAFIINFNAPSSPPRPLPWRAAARRWPHRLPGCDASN